VVAVYQDFGCIQLALVYGYEAWRPAYISGWKGWPGLTGLDVSVGPLNFRLISVPLTLGGVR
jgi:hypothetical protein